MASRTATGSAALRRVAARLKGNSRDNRITLLTATVDSVTAGAAADGNAQLVISIDGDLVASPYLESYTPVVGHLVRVELTDGSPLVTGRIIGLPAY